MLLEVIDISVNFGLDVVLVIEVVMEVVMEEVMEEVMEVHHSQVLLWSDRRQLISGSRETQEPAVESVYSVQCTPAVLYSEVCTIYV